MIRRISDKASFVLYMQSKQNSQISTDAHVDVDVNDNLDEATASLKLKAKTSAKETRENDSCFSSLRVADSVVLLHIR